MHELKITKIIEKHEHRIQHTYCAGLHETLFITYRPYLDIIYPQLVKELKRSTREFTNEN